MLDRKKSILLVCSQISGGTKRHVWEMANEWMNQGHGVVVLETYHTLGKLYILLKGSRLEPVVISLPRDTNALFQLLKAFHIGAVHYHHFLYMDDFWMKLGNRLYVPFYVTLHDYYTICPLIKLIGMDGTYCRLPSVKICHQCLAHKKIYFELERKMDIDDIVKWRAKWEKYLSQAATIFVPHHDVQKRLSKVWPEVKMTVFENPEIVPVSLEAGKAKRKREKIRVGVIGALDEAKGAGVIFGVAEELEKRHLPVELVLFGQFLEHKEPFPRTLTVLGPYTEEKVYQQIADEEIDYFLFPALWPETYSYTLSIPIRLGIPVLGVDIGAIGGRIQEHGWGEVYPYDSSIEYICNRLIHFDYKYYACKKEKFKIKNHSFPLAKDLYGTEIEKKVEMDLGKITEYMLSFNKRVEYVEMKNVIASDFVVLKKWGLSWRAIGQMIMNIKWSWFFKQACRKIYRCIERGR